ncbi:MAG: hypothetical protein HYU67_04545 [Flavobacteriia bacterium]|nr:hypothetical protein [Flavobacteriia bacterium]
MKILGKKLVVFALHQKKLIYLDFVDSKKEADTVLGLVRSTNNVDAYGFFAMNELNEFFNEVMENSPF